MPSAHSDAARWNPTFSAVCAIVGFAFGLLVLFGWWADVPFLRSWGAPETETKITTACALALCGAALWLRVSPLRHHAAAGPIALILLAIQVALGATSLTEHMLTLARESIGPEPPFRHMSLASSVIAIALAGALAGLDRLDARGRRPALALALFAGLIATLTGLNHHFDALVRDGVLFEPRISPQSAIIWSVLILGVLTARRGPGALLVLTSDGPGGALARHVLPVALLMPPLLADLRLRGEVTDWIGPGAATAINVTLLLTLIGTVIWLTAARADQAFAERLRLAESLRENERRSREIIESLPLLVWTCEPDGSCDYVGPQWTTYTGRPTQEHLGRGWIASVHPDDREDMIHRWKQASAAGQPYESDYRLRRHDGCYRWCKTTAQPLRDKTGAIRKWFGATTDVHDKILAEKATHQARKELERKVQERNEQLETAASRLQAALGVSRLGVWEWNARTNEVYLDPQLRRLYGLQADEPVSFQTWVNLLHEEDRERALETARHHIEASADYRDIFRVRLRDGTVRTFLAIGVTLRDANGHHVRTVGVNRDITAEREAEQRLRKGESLLSEFVRHAPAAIAMFDTEMRYLRVSERWKTDYNLGEVELVGRSHYDVFPSLPPRWREVHRRVLEGRVERAAEEIFPLPDGRTEWIEWEARPWRRPDNSIGGLLMFTQIITARKEMELEARRQREDLERSNRDLEQFAYAASHDLQEPLRAIAGCLQLLERRHSPALPAEARELISHGVDGARRMQGLVLDLLTYSRVGTGELRAQHFSLDQPLDEALQNLRSTLEESETVVERPAPLPTIEGDRTRLTLLFQNLVGNAVKYARTGVPPRIRIETTPGSAPGMITVVVRDNGIGIEPRFFNRIFVLFQRLHTREEYPGNGIGLALCKKIVERHGGRIWVESTPGAGSSFYFNLPVPRA